MDRLELATVEYIAWLNDARPQESFAPHLDRTPPGSAHLSGLLRRAARSPTTLMSGT